jgi:hypothetical protein
MVAPQNLGRAEHAFLEELARALRDGFTEQKKSRKPRRESSKRGSRSLAGQRSRFALDRPMLDLGQHWLYSKDFETRR